MKKTTLIVASFVLVLSVMACSIFTPAPSAQDVARELATIQAQDAQSVPAVEGTPQPVSGWQLPEPPLPTWATLPHDLWETIVYVQPPQNCADANDVNQTCSTREGQATSGTATLQPNTALVMTGDNIALSYSGSLLAQRPNGSVAHDLWVLVNDSDHSVDVKMEAPSGSFRGYFTTDSWDPSTVAHLRDLHLERFLEPLWPSSFTPTPVANCDHPHAGCPYTNVRVLVFANGEWVPASIGFYKEWSTNWWTATK